jgi:peptidoglycan/xylan/chitin deacetylase (PgdA/CDA1 family)
MSLEPWAWGVASAGAAGAFALGVFHPRVELFGPVLARGPENRREVALTFDDGPHPDFTPRIARALEGRGVRGTFFCVGERVEQHPGVARALAEGGHQLENHTFRHGIGADLFSARRLTADLERCQAALAAVSGRRPGYYRPAVGVRNPAVHSAARRTSLQVVTWTLAARDGARALTPERARALAHRCEGGEILALHDGTLSGRAALREATVGSLEVLLAALAERGLAAVTLSHLLR